MILFTSTISIILEWSVLVPMVLIHAMATVVVLWSIKTSCMELYRGALRTVGVICQVFILMLAKILLGIS